MVTTQQTAPGNIPALTLGWRLKMALDYSHISVQAMADQLGVTRATLSRWMSDKGARPKKAYVMQWALITGVPYDWLDSGEVTTGRGPGDGGKGGTQPKPWLPGWYVPRFHQTDEPAAPNLSQAS